jgi:hypothetical protein
MELKPGWLNRQFDEVERQIDTWPEWMRREASYAMTEESVRECIEDSGLNSIAADNQPE